MTPAQREEHVAIVAARLEADVRKEAARLGMPDASTAPLQAMARFCRGRWLP